MSRFRRERVYASVELDRVALVRLGADGLPQDEAVVDLVLDPEHPDEWSKAARPALAAPAWRGPARTVVLSDRLVRYVVMERPQGVRSSAELRLACEARFQASFERPASEWEIAIDARPFADDIFACGVSRRLLDAVRGLFAAQPQKRLLHHIAGPLGIAGDPLRVPQQRPLELGQRRSNPLRPNGAVHTGRVGHGTSRR